MDEPTQPPRPDPQTFVNVQKQEIDRLNDNRIYLMALIEEIKGEASQEIERLTAELDALKASQLEASWNGESSEGSQ